ncbi:MAG: glutamate--tRNA ligase, partial [Bacteroidetes bacterium]
AWCGLQPHESPANPGKFGPYRQSERKALYTPYAEQLVEQGHAYYAFDTPEELERMRQNFKTEANPSPTYDGTTRLQMRNSLTLTPQETETLLANGTPRVVRIKMPHNQNIEFADMIRGSISFNSSMVDDKVLLKADGMPTYHLAVVVDDYLMEITHAFRGEEWLSSAPVHVLLWQYLGWQQHMPQWAHLPLILGPDGAKLSKRHGNKYGFPIFAMNWTDPSKSELTEGFKERGFLPEAFINLLALMGWNDGTGQEIFSKAAMAAAFDMSRVHSAGAQFDYEKAKWYNQEWIKRLADTDLAERLKRFDEGRFGHINQELLGKVVGLVKERCHLLTDFWNQASFFFQPPETFDTNAIAPKWTSEKTAFFQALLKDWGAAEQWEPSEIEQRFKNLANTHLLKPGELMLPLRIMLVGGKFGPGVFDVATMVGQPETLRRIEHVLQLLFTANASTEMV